MKTLEWKKKKRKEKKIGRQKLDMKKLKEDANKKITDYTVKMITYQNCELFNQCDQDSFFPYMILSHERIVWTNPELQPARQPSRS